LLFVFLHEHPVKCKNIRRQSKLHCRNRNEHGEPIIQSVVYSILLLGSLGSHSQELNWNKGSGCYLFKKDLSQAYCQLYIDPHNCHLLGHHQGYNWHLSPFTRPNSSSWLHTPLPLMWHVLPDVLTLKSLLTSLFFIDGSQPSPTQFTDPITAANLANPISQVQAQAYAPGTLHNLHSQWKLWLNFCALMTSPLYLLHHMPWTLTPVISLARPHHTSTFWILLMSSDFFTATTVVQLTPLTTLTFLSKSADQNIS